VKILVDDQEVDLTIFPMIHVEDAVDVTMDPSVDLAVRQRAKLAQWWV